MKAQDLRIGNLIRWDLNDPRSDDDFDYGYDECPISLWQLSEPDRISPIPLTEEWLVKLGFEYYNSECLRHNEFKTLEAYKHVMKDGFGIVLKGFHTVPFVKNVHQLQNLYFALTGEELMIK